MFIFWRIWKSEISGVFIFITGVFIFWWGVYFFHWGVYFLMGCLFWSVGCLFSNETDPRQKISIYVKNSYFWARLRRKILFSIMCIFPLNCVVSWTINPHKSWFFSRLLRDLGRESGIFTLWDGVSIFGGGVFIFVSGVFIFESGVFIFWRFLKSEIFLGCLFWSPGCLFSSPWCLLRGNIYFQFPGSECQWLLINNK